MSLSSADAVRRMRRLIEREVADWSTVLDLLESALARDLEGANSHARVDGLTGVADEALSAMRDRGTFGCGFVAAPGSFADSPGLMWMTKDREGAAAHRLAVDAEFYEYTSAPWWLGALRSDHDHTTGPYVDASGTNQYIVTHSRRALRDELVVGVLAVDILVVELQRLFHEVLGALPLGSCLVDADNAVLATNTGRLLGETVAFAEPRRHEAVFQATGWRLLVGTRTRASAAHRR